MSSDAKPMRHLLWKDALTIKSMMITALVAIAALNLLLLITSSSRGETRHSVDPFLFLWILMPNLVALGSPALLIGSEQESGTLSWLRTLPIRWQQIADSKFIVSLAAVTVTWVVASLPMAAFCAAVNFHHTPMSEQFLNVPGVLQLAFFSLLLLSCGFITAYLFRSPLTALITLVPLIFVVNLVVIDIGSVILFGQFSSTERYVTAEAGWAWCAVLAILTLVALFFVQRWLAYRRLSRPAVTIQNHVAIPTASSLPPSARMGLDQPSRVTALLWQQSQQLGIPGLLLVIVMIWFIILNRSTGFARGTIVGLDLVAGMSPLFIALGASWLGALSFYGDNVRRRCTFLADRGISPNLIWWTRLFFPVLLCSSLVLLQFGLMTLTFLPRPRPVDFFIPGMIVVMFAFGQLVALWMPRATLSFFAAPTYAGAVLFVSSGLFPGFDIDSAATLVFVPVLLFATWRLTPRWLSGKIDAGFHGRVVAYTLFAMMLPGIAVLANRIWATHQTMTFEAESTDNVTFTQVSADEMVASPPSEHSQLPGI